jgi:hypothetical protein
MALFGQMLLSRRAQGIDRARAVHAVELDLTEGGRLGESPDLRTRARALCPRQRFRILGVARAHHDVVAERDELPGQRLPNHAGTQDTVFHARFL